MSVGNSSMMQQFVEACLAALRPKPDVAHYLGTLAVFAHRENQVYMTVRVTETEGNIKLVDTVCIEWEKVCGGDHKHENQVLSSGRLGGPVTRT